MKAANPPQVPVSLDSDKLRQFFIEDVSRFCDKCGTAYTKNDIGLISESNVAVIIQAQCPKCKSMYLAHVIKPLHMTKKVPFKIDIHPKYIRGYYALGQITASELLDLREKLLMNKHTASTLLKVLSLKKRVVDAE